MNILIFNWRDIKHPRAGGAEVVTHELAKKLIERGHKITLFCAYFRGAKKKEIIDGIEVIRKGNPVTVYLFAYFWYRKMIKRGLKFDLVIDEVNAIPFFTPFYVKGKKIAFFHQLAREVWFYESVFPVNIIGYLLEPLFLRPYKKIPTITISSSTKEDLVKQGLGPKNIFVCPEAIDIDPLESLEKKKGHNFIFVGRLTKSKRIGEIIKAFKLVNKKLPESKLWIVGKEEKKYKKELQNLAKKLKIKNKVKFWGFVSPKLRNKLMSKAYLLILTSVKEGWGLVVTEAGALGTPAVVYKIDGLRESVKHRVTGVVCNNKTPQKIARWSTKLCHDKNLYERLRKNSWHFSKQFTWDNTVDRFEEIVKKI